jgi:hypothetical protein
MGPTQIWEQTWGWEQAEDLTKNSWDGLERYYSFGNVRGGREAGRGRQAEKGRWKAEGRWGRIEERKYVA